MKTVLFLVMFGPLQVFANEYTCQSRLEHALTLESEKQATLYRCVDLKCNFDPDCGGLSDEELCPEQAQNLADAKAEVEAIRKQCHD